MESENPSISYNKNFNQTKQYHYINATINVRKLSIEPGMKDLLVFEMKELVPEVKLTDHILVPWSQKKVES